MNRIIAAICFCSAFIFVVSCSRPDLTEDLRESYREAVNSSSDSTSDEDITGDETTNPSLPECSASSGTPCKDSASGLIWSSKASDSMTWDDAVSYCDNLTACGYSDWHLPTISELRTLIQNCPATETGGNCGVTDSCLSYSSCWSEESCYSCSYEENGGYSKLGDTGWFWSSSLLSDKSNVAWYVGFYDGIVSGGYIDYYGNYVRCVR